MTNDLILLSGGMDSTVALAQADHYGTARYALSVNYGQRHRRELLAAHTIAHHYRVDHAVLDLTSWGQLLTGSSLTDPTVNIPHGHYAAPTMVATIVPNRNATLLMAAAGVALSRGCDRVVIAAHAGDHPVYPDCRPEFLAAANTALQLATEGQVSIHAPFAERSKTDIARLGHALGAPLGLTWSCYEGGALHCGQCGTCVERAEAFHDAGVLDPTEYAS